MLRTQVSLTEDQKQLLDTKSAESGLSLSELVRRAVDRCYGGGRDLERDLSRLRAGVGAWADRDETGESYVERVRSGRRLADA
ncbi:MAG: ribbon-helix-helix protein, CopG family [Pseudonocardiales bacterium]